MSQVVEVMGAKYGLPAEPGDVLLLSSNVTSAERRPAFSQWARRVPGGWLFITQDSEGLGAIATTFVPDPTAINA